jgi:predicted nuclease of predicted toxin-antitoxin system
VRLLLDEHYAAEIAIQLRGVGHDVVTVLEQSLTGTDDERLLALAGSDGRALLTNNARDFIPIVARWAQSGESHCGLVLTSDSSMPRARSSVGLYVRTLRSLMDSNPEPRALADRVLWLP